MNFDFFSKLDRGGQFLIIFLCLSTLIAFVGFAIWLVLEIKSFLKGRNIQTGNWRLSEKQNNEGVSHCDCPFLKDIVNILALQQRTLIKIFEIKETEILREQMAFAERQIELSYGLAEKIFCEIMEENHIVSYTLSTEYASYITSLLLIKEKLIIKFRHMCKENHLTEKSEDEFKQYIQDHTIILTDMILYLSKIYFPYHSTIPTFRSKINQIYPDIKKHIVASIENAREVSREKNKEIALLQAVYDEEYEKITASISMRVER